MAEQAQSPSEGGKQDVKLQPKLGPAIAFVNNKVERWSTLPTLAERRRDDVRRHNLADIATSLMKVRFSLLDDEEFYLNKEERSSVELLGAEMVSDIKKVRKEEAGRKKAISDKVAKKLKEIEGQLVKGKKGLDEWAEARRFELMQQQRLAQSAEKRLTKHGMTDIASAVTESARAAGNLDDQESLDAKMEAIKLWRDQNVDVREKSVAERKQKVDEWAKAQNAAVDDATAQTLGKAQAKHDAAVAAITEKAARGRESIASRRNTVKLTYSGKMAALQDNTGLLPRQPFYENFADRVLITHLNGKRKATPVHLSVAAVVTAAAIAVGGWANWRANPYSVNSVQVLVSQQLTGQQVTGQQVTGQHMTDAAMRDKAIQGVKPALERKQREAVLKTEQEAKESAEAEAKSNEDAARQAKLRAERRIAQERQAAVAKLDKSMEAMGELIFTMKVGNKKADKQKYDEILQEFERFSYLSAKLGKLTVDQIEKIERLTSQAVAKGDADAASIAKLRLSIFEVINPPPAPPKKPEPQVKPAQPEPKPEPKDRPVVPTAAVAPSSSTYTVHESTALAGKGGPTPPWLKDAAPVSASAPVDAPPKSEGKSDSKSGSKPDSKPKAPQRTKDGPISEGLHAPRETPMQVGNKLFAYPGLRLSPDSDQTVYGYTTKAEAVAAYNAAKAAAEKPVDAVATHAYVKDEIERIDKEKAADVDEEEEPSLEDDPLTELPSSDGKDSTKKDADEVAKDMGLVR